MKQGTTRTFVLLAGALALTLAARAQNPAATAGQAGTYDLGATLSLEHAQVAQVNGNSFWLKGGSVEGSLRLFGGLGVAANFTGEHASNIQGTIGLGKLAFMAGPRYTIDTSHATSRLFKHHRTELFGEWLFGRAHAFDSVFPASGGTTPSAGAFSMQAGGGADIVLAKGFAVRALELDYVHTALPNNASNSQNGLRIAFGLTYRNHTR